MTTEPTFTRVPDGDETTGQEAVDLGRAYGIALDEWQADVVRGILREAGGSWAATQAGLVVARQSGKGQILAALEVAGLLLLGETVLHTAHATKTSTDAFRRLWGVIDGHDDLRRLVKRHSLATGAEFVELKSGARAVFTTRSASAGRGLSIDRLIVDEAEDLPAAEVAALAPTVFSRPHAQSLYFGTAPGPMHDAEAFETMRHAAHEGLNPRLAWWEWCAEWGESVDDRELWVRVNPAVSTGRVPIQAIEDDRSVLPVDAFRAERLSMWTPRTAASSTFDVNTWTSLEDVDSLPITDLSVGIDAPPSRDTATVCLAGRREDGTLHVEWYETAPGVTWVPSWCAPRLRNAVRAVVIDERSPLAELDWTSAGVRPTRVGSRAVAEAAGGLVDAVADGALRHPGQAELSKGVLAAKQRPMLGGNGFAWDRKGAGSSVLIAASLALWGVTADKPTSPMPPPRRRVVVRS